MDNAPIAAGTRPHSVAASDWKSVSLELQVFSTPEIKVTETTTRKTVVAGKWVFLQRD
jgi:hypothetical protein